MKNVWTVCAMMLALSTVACFGKCGDDDKKPEGKKQWKVDKSKTKKTNPPKSNDTKTDKAPSGQPVEGKVFNKAFPDDGFQGYKRVFTTEKTGFAAADFKKDGKTIVKVNFTDTKATPKDTSRYEASTEKIGGFPYITRGKNSSLVFAKGRYQVKVSSKTLDEQARKAFLEAIKFNELP